HTLFSVGIPVAMNGRNLVRRVGAVVENANEPALMFVAIPRSSEGRSVVDVLDLGAGGNVRFDTNPFQVGVQSIPAPGAAIVMDYFRQ
ncbi:MAG: hypothetical protein O7B99_10150, partial [Planctomycetota bacterium]|nr:hypothetical protein [Planctomycetota bacterium]